MALKIEETFQVRAPVDRVWRYLVDPQQVVRCLPGAELTEVQDDRTYLGRIKVKVGPVVAGYNGRATIVEQDDAAHVVRLAAEGREAGGAGSARMTMTSRLAALADGSTEVHVVADVDIVGKVVQFGRGMIESVSKQLFKQFTDCARAQLETAAAAPVETAAAAPVEIAAAAPLATASASDAAPDALPPAMATPVGSAAPVATGINAAPSLAAEAQPPMPAAAAPPAGAPLRVLPLIVRALRDAVARALGRLFPALFRRS